jgi:hypothetical protein
MTLLPNQELGAVEEWFSEVLTALGFAPNTDRGRVLKGIQKLKAEALAYEEEKRKVMSAYGHKRWGDLLNICESKLSKTPEVVVPDVFYIVPNKWCLREGGMLFDKAEKRLKNETLRLVKQVWSSIAESEAEEGTEWAEEQRKFFVEEFERSEEPYSFEQTCLAFIKGYYGDEEGPDPSKVWITASDEGRDALIASDYLPPYAVDNLLDYADNEGVEITQAEATTYNVSEFAGARWFRFMLCAYLTKEQRPHREAIFQLWDDLRSATTLGKLFNPEAGGMLRAGVREGEWDPTATLDDIVTAYYAYKETSKAIGDVATHDEIAEAIMTALGRTPVEN